MLASVVKVVLQTASFFSRDTNANLVLV